MTSSATARSRVLFFSDVPIGAQLTGPAIRTLELARQVSRVAEVTIAAYGSIERETPGLTPRCFTTEREVLELAQAHDAFVAQGFFTFKYTKLLLSDRVKIFDLYDPLTLETLEHGRHIPPDQRRREYAMIQSVVHGQLATGDFFLCANERQRDYYLGLLANAGRLNPVSYDVADRDLRHLLAVVPMGLSADRPVHARSVLRGVHPAIKSDDFVLIWGGSLLDWLDPLTLIRAMARVHETRPDVKLFFLASQNPILSDTHSIATRAIELSRQLGLLDQTVIFNREWVAYDDRANYLLEADIGVTAHLDHLETRFSFRTRMLDYLWAGLPMISSEGDAFGDLIQRQHLGLTVPPGAIEALAQAILKLADEADLRQAYADNVRRVAEAFHWDKVAQPLVDFCRAPQPAIDRDFDHAGTAWLDRRSANLEDGANAQVKAAVRRLRRSPQALLSARVKMAAKKILKKGYTANLYDRMIEAEGELLRGQRRGQTFRAVAPYLSGLQVLIGTFGRVNTCDVVLHVCESPDVATEIISSRVNAMLLPDCKLCLFSFPPIANSIGREFYVWLESPDAVASDCVTLFHYLENGELVFMQQYPA